MNKKYKIIAVFMLVCTLLNLFSNIFAAYDNSNVDLGKHNIYYNRNENRYISYNGVSQRFFDYYYLDNSGDRYPAYCIDLGDKGAEYGEYEVDVDSKLADSILNQIVLNGYPYKTHEELGLDNNDEARFATQFAIWVYTNPLDLNKIQALNDDGKKVKAAIEKIYRDGTTKHINEDNILKVREVENGFKLDNLDDNYYSKVYKLEYNENIKNINLEVKGVTNYIITDVNNKRLESLNGIREFKILVPRKDIVDDKNITINFKTDVKETTVLFGLAPTEPKRQNVVLALKPIKTNDLQIETNLKYQKTTLKLKKVDLDDSSVVIPNVKFKIYDSKTNSLLGTFITDEKGEINLDIQKDLGITGENSVIIEEVEVPDEYYIDVNRNKKELKFEIGKENIVVFENEKIKGRIKIVKLTKEYNKLSDLPENSYLEGVEFNILDENDNIVETLVTNENGEAVSKELLKGKYKVKEIKTQEHYVLDDVTYEVEIKEHGKEEVLEVYNENVTYSIELPKTGI